MTFTLCSSEAIVRKAGAFASPAAIASNALLLQYCTDAEGEVCMKTRYDWVAHASEADVRIINSIGNAVSNLAAIKVINYNLAGYSRILEAQTIMDVLNNDADTTIKDIREKPFQKFSD
jgi:hypothetical protein